MVICMRLIKKREAVSGRRLGGAPSMMIEKGYQGQKRDSHLVAVFSGDSHRHRRIPLHVDQK